MASHHASRETKGGAAKCVRGKGKINFFVRVVKRPEKKGENQEQRRAEQQDIRGPAKWKRTDIQGFQ